MIDLQFIEITNRWISETQVKIKSEVGANNQQAETFKNLVLSYQNQLDSILNPNLDKEVTIIINNENKFSTSIYFSHQLSVKFEKFFRRLSY